MMEILDAWKYLKVGHYFKSESLGETENNAESKVTQGFPWSLSW